MAVRVVNSCPIFRCACSPSPPLSPSRCLSFHFRPFKPHKNPSNLGFHSLRTRSQVFSFGARSRFFNSLVESVMEELKAMSTRRRIRANGRSEVVFFCFFCVFIFKVLIFIFFYGSLIGSLAYVAELDDFFNPRKTNYDCSNVCFHFMWFPALMMCC